ncbi:hypothetical protein Mal52_32060 [Symmachiella dynata]|uniref:DUF1553 domain-containing protein n=1 Tax=Symmachiella dynata TaxID=2527995 RepID=A0A517ZQG4_9PLAN|nr:DUF1549 domain-containing protein [Symmachiella dynata]QDU44720.1 hypothetical protein Mal52_32060 [Symmachiella dynata]
MSDLSQRDRACLLGVLSSCLLLGLPTLSAAEHAPKADSLKVEIDNRIEAGWKGQGVTPAVITSDSEFLRRVSLDLVGRIPTIAEVRGFLADDKPQKRERLVDRLLSSPEFAHHAATILRRMWIPQTDTQEFKRLIFDYESWLARRLRERAPFDELVRQQLCVPVNGMAVPINPDGDEIGSSAFIAVSDMKPEILAANTARAFQGINIDCAQCHDHPFARWTREQFWQTAAFFTRPSTDVAQPNAALTIAVDDTEMTVEATLFTSKPVKWPNKIRVGTGRELLADWIISSENPYFARNAVNRMWANFLGTGFIEPLDDLSGAIPASHPQLLDRLAEAFVQSDFDLRFLVRTIVLSRSYQLSTVSSSDSSLVDDPQLFAQMPTRSLTGEQLYNSLRTAAGLKQDVTATHLGYRKHPRQKFAARFLVQRPSEGQRALVQTLLLMNGSLTGEATAAGQTPLLVAIESAPFLSDKERVETLFLATYSRRPSEGEGRPLADHLKQSEDRSAALADIFWALLNSSEFNTNH